MKAKAEPWGADLVYYFVLGRSAYTPAPFGEIEGTLKKRMVAEWQLQLV